MPFVCHLQTVWTPRERAEILAKESRLAASEGRDPARIPKRPPPRRATFETQEEANKQAALWRARNPNAAVTVTEVCPRVRHQQLSFATDWPRQTRPGSR